MKKSLSIFLLLLLLAACLGACTPASPATDPGSGPAAVSEPAEPVITRVTGLSKILAESYASSFRIFCATEQAIFYTAYIDGEYALYEYDMARETSTLRMSGGCADAEYFGSGILALCAEWTENDRDPYRYTLYYLEGNKEPREIWKPDMEPAYVELQGIGADGSALLFVCGGMTANYDLGAYIDYPTYSYYTLAPAADPSELEPVLLAHHETEAFYNSDRTRYARFPKDQSKEADECFLDLYENGAVTDTVSFSYTNRYQRLHVMYLGDTVIPFFTGNADTHCYILPQRAGEAPEMVADLEMAMFCRTNGSDTLLFGPIKEEALAVIVSERMDYKPYTIDLRDLVVDSRFEDPHFATFGAAFCGENSFVYCESTSNTVLKVDF